MEETRLSKEIVVLQTLQLLILMGLLLGIIVTGGKTISSIQNLEKHKACFNILNNAKYPPASSLVSKKINRGLACLGDRYAASEEFKSLVDTSNYLSEKENELIDPAISSVIGEQVDNLSNLILRSDS